MVSERAQSNVTDITSGHQAAADSDSGQAGGCERGEESAGPDGLEMTPGLLNTDKVSLPLCLLCWQLVGRRKYFVMSN